MWQTGELRNLGVVDDDVASAAGSINNQGDVVGFSITKSFASRAFLWRKGVMTDLNTVISANAGWALMSAGHINDAGQIVGYGMLNGSLHAFLLTPRPGRD
jgi:probable HAF family extracellular repeat protein